MVLFIVRAEQGKALSAHGEEWEQLKLKYFFWVVSKDDLTNGCSLVGKYLCPYCYSPRPFSLLTLLCKCQKISQTWLRPVLSCYVLVLTHSACLLIWRQSAFKSSSLQGKVNLRLIPKTYVNQSKCPKDWGLLMRYLKMAIRHKSASIWWMLPLNDLLPLRSQSNCVWMWSVDLYW